MVASRTKVISDRELGILLRPVLIPLSDGKADYDPLMEAVGDARFVLLGESSHGTHEFYSARADITRRLITEKNFNAVAVEADWPDAYRVNRFVRGLGPDTDPIEALADFKRFPTWMWRNDVLLDFIGWLAGHNRGLPAARQVGFYGLDLYSLFTSIDAVIRYLESVDPEAAVRAKRRYACFDHFRADAQAYGYSAALRLTAPCENEVLAQLSELRRSAFAYLRRDGFVANEELFYATQNARLAISAEEYYRSMFDNRVNSWNLRDQHMADTLAALAAHLRGVAGESRIAVWAHNSHLGDARATEMSAIGELNVGQLVRERWGSESFSVGFSTCSGTVSAASEWDGPVMCKRVRPAMADSYEKAFHESEMERFLLLLTSTGANPPPELRLPRLQRAIGVIYRPKTERDSHYYFSCLPDQFDAMIHIDHTRAVAPLERTAEWMSDEPPETYPFGF